MAVNSLKWRHPFFFFFFLQVSWIFSLLEICWLFFAEPQPCSLSLGLLSTPGCSHIFRFYPLYSLPLTPLQLSCALNSAFLPGVCSFQSKLWKGLALPSCFIRSLNVLRITSMNQVRGWKLKETLRMKCVWMLKGLALYGSSE